MQDQLKTIATIVSLVIIIFWTGKGCYYCLQGLVDDDAGWWITLGEGLAALAWSLIGLTVLIYSTHHASEFILGAMFWIAMGCKSVSCIVKSEFGYRVIRDTYRRRNLR